MPTYPFRNKITGEEFTQFMGISACDEFLKAHPDLELGVSTPAIISGVSGRLKPDQGFRDLLRTIKDNNPNSTINTFD